jgi:uncharacterized protein (TIGR03118 family)
MNHRRVGRTRALVAPAADRRKMTVIALPLLVTVTIVTVFATTLTAGAQPVTPGFTRTNLVANSSSFGPKLVDPNLQNAWGLASSPGGPIWVSDNNSGKVTVYTGGVDGSAVSLQLTVSVPGGNATGQAYNPTSDFPVGGSSGSPAAFVVSSDSVGSKQSPGQIEAWNGGSKFVVEDSPKGAAGGTTPANAVFKGIAIAPKSKYGPLLYAADVANATVDVFNDQFQPMNLPGAFIDPYLPAGYAPFNVAYIAGKIYVTYGMQNAKKTNVVPGAGLGVVDVYSVNGKLIRHLISNGSSSPLNEPWGLAIAPSGFGPFAGDLLVGNLGNGWINAFDPSTGAQVGTIDNSKGYPMKIDGLWGLEVGNSSFGGASSVVFSAGPSGYSDGLLGTLTWVS